MHSESEESHPSGDGLSDALVRAQLDKILGSEVFSRSERLSAFLRYIVDETLNGRGDSLKEQVLAAELYGKRVGFNAAEDTAVRNDARRLRDKLREYYEGSARDPVIVSVPKGAYTPVFERNAAFAVPAIVPICPPPPSQTAKATGRRPWIVAIVASIALALTFWIWPWSRTNEQLSVWQPSPVTSMPGFEGVPSLSPDGNFVAFSSTGSQRAEGQHDIYIKAVHGEALRRLTNTPVSELRPAWSPDGSQIAFGRPGQGVFVMSQLGGPERRIAESGMNPAWTPDSQSVLIRDRAGDRPFGIFQISLDTLQRRQLTQPSSGLGDWTCAVSPDGTTLAFIRALRAGIADVYTVPMNGGEPQRRTNWDATVGTVAWAPGQGDLIFDAGYGYPLSLWRISARGTRPERGTQVLLPMNAHGPSISRPAPGQPARLAFLTLEADISLRLIDLEAPRSVAVLESASPLFDSTAVEIPGSFSRDGTRIAFNSNRMGRHVSGSTPQLWVGRRDGTDLRQLTRLDSPEVRSPSWSPDDRQIVFEATIAGNTDIFAIGAEGGEAKRLTSEISIDNFPNWSQDGRAIYFSSDRTGRSEVWRMEADGGRPTQITRNGGFEPMPSVDGGSLYYLHPVPGSPAKLMQVPAGGGEEKVVLEEVSYARWAVTKSGIFFLTRDGEFNRVDLYEPAQEKVRRIGRLPFPISEIGDVGRFTVSPDGRWGLANQTDRWEADIMMIDRFR